MLMKVPYGINEVNIEQKVCLLRKAIYGLRQAGVQWYKHLDEVFDKIGCQQLKSTNCVYIYENKGLILVYVDDLLMFGQNSKVINEMKEKISYHLEVKDLGEPSNVLGVNVIHNTDGSWGVWTKKDI